MIIVFRILLITKRFSPETSRLVSSRNATQRIASRRAAPALALFPSPSFFSFISASWGLVKGYGFQERYYSGASRPT